MDGKDFEKTLDRIANELGDISCIQLSFRDQCAIAAMIMSEAYLNRIGSIPPPTKGEIATDAFNLADAMEAERLKRGAK